MGLGLNSYYPVERNSINAVWQRRLGPAQIKDHRFLIIEIKKTLSTEHTQNSWRSKMEEGTTSQKGMPQTSLLESILAERGVHTQKGFWDIPNTGSEPGRSNDWPNEAQKKCTIKDIQTNEGVTLSLRLPVHLSTHTILISNQHFTCFPTFHLYVEIHFYTAGRPGPCHWPLVPCG